MGWETTNFALERHGDLARVFNFEIMLSGAAGRHRLLRGDGLIMRDGTVRLNRSDHIKDLVEQEGFNPESFLRNFADWVLSQAVSQLAEARAS